MYTLFDTKPGWPLQSEPAGQVYYDGTAPSQLMTRAPPNFNQPLVQPMYYQFQPACYIPVGPNIQFRPRQQSDVYIPDGGHTYNAPIYNYNYHTANHETAINVPQYSSSSGLSLKEITYPDHYSGPQHFSIPISKSSIPVSQSSINSVFPSSISSGFQSFNIPVSQSSISSGYQSSNIPVSQSSISSGFQSSISSVFQPSVIPVSQSSISSGFQSFNIPVSQSSISLGFQSSNIPVSQSSISSGFQSSNIPVSQSSISSGFQSSNIPVSQSSISSGFQSSNIPVSQSSISSGFHSSSIQVSQSSTSSGFSSSITSVFQPSIIPNSQSSLSSGYQSSNISASQSFICSGFQSSTIPVSQSSITSCFPSFISSGFPSSISSGSRSSSNSGSPESIKYSSDTDKLPEFFRKPHRLGNIMDSLSLSGNSNESSSNNSHTHDDSIIHTFFPASLCAALNGDPPEPTAVAIPLKTSSPIGKNSDYKGVQIDITNLRKRRGPDVTSSSSEKCPRFSENGISQDLDQCDKIIIRSREKNSAEDAARRREEFLLILEAERERQKKLVLPKHAPKMSCKFCRNNGEQSEVYTKHRLHFNEKTVCPILRHYVCRLCNSTGDFAHTVRHCPFNDKKDQIAWKATFLD